MQVLGDAVARDRRSGATALRHAPTDREYDYRRFCTTAWKVGNFLRNEGVREGATVVVADEPDPEPVVTLYGAALLGATVTFSGETDDRTRALVVPTNCLAEFDADPRTRRIGYGAEPPTPGAAYFERDVWSENPTMPPDSVAADAPVLQCNGETYTHADLLAAARDVVETYGLDVGDCVAVRSPLADPGVAVAGVVAPVLAGATVLFPADEPGDVGVGEDVLESRAVDPDEVL